MRLGFARRTVSGAVSAAGASVRASVSAVALFSLGPPLNLCGSLFISDCAAAGAGGAAEMLGVFVGEGEDSSALGKLALLVSELGRFD